MNNEKIQILSKYLGEYHEDSSNVYFYCPYCHHHKKKLSISLIEDIYHCWVCDKSGRVYRLFRDLKASKEDIEKYSKISKNKIFIKNDIKEEKLYLPIGFKNLLSRNDDIFRIQVLNYVYERNLTNFHIKFYNLGYCEEYKNYLVIPSYDVNKELNYYQCRSILKDPRQKYINPKIEKTNIIPFEYYVNFEEPVVFVEGFFDINTDFNCLPLFGSSIHFNGEKSSKIVKKIIESNAPSVYIMLDSDAIIKSYKICKKFYELNIETYFVDIFPNKDPGSLNYKQYKSFIQNAILLDDKKLFDLFVKSKERKFK